jgi:TPR repeat protein
MAHLIGQLGLSPSPEAALPLLQRAATIATVDVPQPAYVFGLLLLGEFSQASIPPHLFTPFIPPGSTRDSEARRHLERAAYLNFPPAQYKLGHAYEFAQPPFPFDALLSVQYYSLASQQGEIEADMALSKWFLCGSEGAFDKDESLAFTFAEKAARKGLPSAEFAMGYYTEVGVGGPKDIEAARKWYTRVSNKSDASHLPYLMYLFTPCIQASQHGNTDATDRLAALSQPAPAALSRQEHDNLTEVKLVRKRTQAKQRSDARGPGAGPRQLGRQNSQQVVANIRKNSLAYRPGPNQGYPSSSGPVAPARFDNAAPEGYFSQRPPQAPPSSSPDPSGGLYRPPTTQPGPLSDPSGYIPPQRQQQPLPASQPQYTPPALQGPTNSPGPGGYPSPRIPPYRPPSQPQLGTPGPPGQYGRGRTGRGNSGSGLPPAGVPSSSSSQQVQQSRVSTPSPSPPGPSEPLARPPPGKGPATFQEMGYQSSKLEEKDCVIM